MCICTCTASSDTGLFRRGSKTRPKRDLYRCRTITIQRLRKITGVTRVVVVAKRDYNYIRSVTVLRTPNRRLVPGTNEEGIDGVHGVRDTLDLVKHYTRRTLIVQ